MLVEQIMTKRVASCTPGDTLNEAARIMWERDCGIVPVVEEGPTRRVVGVVTDRDACMAAYTRGCHSQIRIGDVGAPMRRRATLARMSTRRRIGCDTPRSTAPVVDNANQLLGIVSLADIAREVARDRLAAPEVTAMELGETLTAFESRVRSRRFRGGPQSWRNRATGGWYTSGRRVDAVADLHAEHARGLAHVRPPSPLAPGARARRGASATAASR
jgi:CBS domain-containing protein